MSRATTAIATVGQDYTSTFTKLPTEIVEQIAFTLIYADATLNDPRPSPIDLVNLRLTCRTLREKTTDAFQECLKSYWCNYANPESVKRLEAFCQTDLVQRTCELRLPGPRTESDWTHDHSHLESVFLSFPNLNSVRIEQNPKDDCFGASTIGELPNPQSSSWPRTQEIRKERWGRFVADIIVQLFQASSASQGMMKRLCIGDESRFPLEGPSVSVDAFKKFGDLIDCSRLGEMRSLSIYISTSTHVYVMQLMDHNRRGASDTMGFLLGAMPKLEQLAVTADSWVFKPQGITMFRFFSTLSSHKFSYLSHIAISGGGADLDDMAAFVLSHNETLRTVKLDKIIGHSPTIEPLLAALESCPRLRLLVLQRIKCDQGTFTFPLGRLYTFGAEESGLDSEQWQIVKHWPWRILLDSRTDNIHVQLRCIRQAGPNIIFNFAGREQAERDGWQVMDYPETANQYLV